MLLHSPAIASRLHHVVRLSFVHQRDWLTIMERKWSRRHLGNPSYQERGVSLEAYAVYWNHYVYPRFLEHSARDEQVAAAATGSPLLDVDTCEPLDAVARRVLSRVGLPPPAPAPPAPPAGQLRANG